MDTALDPDLVERFEAALFRLWRGERLGLAVSGGPDSMAMLLLASSAMRDRIEVATVDHGLRLESAGECALVTRVCAEHDIACEVLPVRVEEGNRQEMARRARYAALGAWATKRGLEGVATAHHADDQAETLLMRLNRGSGISGLASIRERIQIGDMSVPILRPLLGFRRAELRRIVEDSGTEFVEDPSNTDDRYDRARIRKGLAEADWIDPSGLALSAAHLAEAETTLQRLADRTWDDAAELSADEVVVPQTADRDTNARLLSRAIARLGGLALRGEVAGFLDRLDGRGNLAGVVVERAGDRFVCRREPPRKTG